VSEGGSGAGGSGFGGSGFDWGLRPSGTPAEPDAPTPPPAEPLPAPPEPEQPTQLLFQPDAEPEQPTQLLSSPDLDPDPDPEQASEQATELFSHAAPGSAIDALFGESQFREYEPGVLNPNEQPFAARAAAAERLPDGAELAGMSRAQKVLLSIVGGLVAVLALVALFFVGTRLPALTAHAPATPSSTPSSTPSPTSTARAVGPVADGIHPWSALLGGECLDPFAGPWAETFTVVDCAKPHPAQMVFRGTFDTSADPAYPGPDKLQSQIALLCAAPGVINLAVAGAYTDVQLQGSYAVDEDQWAAGEHDYFCFVNRASGQPLTGSVAVPHAAPTTPAP
jgi:hypothetical protein